jgi:hypothetical protein
MNVFRHNDSSLGCVKYVKSILPQIGNVSSLQIYFNDEDIPKQYKNVADVDVFDGEASETESTYLFIARNDKEDKELWLTGCTCGYKGTGPSTTHEVLELLGIKMDYSRIYNEKKILEREVTPHHSLNITFHLPQTENPYQAGEKHLKVTASFDYPDQRLKALDALKIFGKIKHNRLFQHKDKQYLPTEYTTDQIHYNYSTNHDLVLTESWSKFDDKILIMAIEVILENYDGTHKIQKIDKTGWQKL